MSQVGTAITKVCQLHRYKLPRTGNIFDREPPFGWIRLWNFRPFTRLKMARPYGRCKRKDMRGYQIGRKIKTDPWCRDCPGEVQWRVRSMA